MTSLDQDPAERIRDVVRAIPGVGALGGGASGQVASYLPGRRVIGVRLGSDRATIQVTASYGHPLPEVARRIRNAVARLVETPVDVVISDLQTPDEAMTSAAGTPAAADPPPPTHRTGGPS